MNKLAIVINLDKNDSENIMTRFTSFEKGAETIAEIQKHKGWRILETFLANEYGVRVENKEEKR